MTSNCPNKSKALFFADTPLQVFNACMLASQLANDFDSDIVLINQFKGAKGVAKRLSQLGLFSSVFNQEPLLFVTANERRFKTAAIHFGASFLNLDYLKLTKYDFLFLACPTPTSNEVLLCLRAVNRSLKTALYEDGTGSYNGNILRGVNYIDQLPVDCVANTARADLQVRLFRALGKGKTIYKPEAIYLYRPDAVAPKYQFPVHRLLCSSACAELLKTVFVCDLTVLMNSDAVILDSVRRKGEEDAGAATIDSLLAVLPSACENISFKLHPRTLNMPQTAKGLTLLNGFWELQCAECDIENKTLVSVASSAMTAPVMMFGKEPFLIYLFEMLPSNDEPRKALYRSIYKSAKALYRDKSKVIAPKTIEETIGALERAKANGR